MKKIIIVLALASFPILTLAFSSEIPFGGVQITNTTMPPVTCNGTGIITLNPARGTTPFPHSTGASSMVWVGSARNGVPVLGFYKPDSSNCYIQIGPYRYNVNTYIWTRYGTSK